MPDLQAFREGLAPYLCADPRVRPFVCSGSPFECRSFIVGLNAATRLQRNFASYWSDTEGFDRNKFDEDYRGQRSLKGNRLWIEAIASEISPCLETNLFATPTAKAKQLTKADRLNPIVSYLFKTIKPELVFVHSNVPIGYFKPETGCIDFTDGAKRARWHGHEFWLQGRGGPLYRMSLADACALGKQMATRLVR